MGLTSLTISGEPAWGRGAERTDAPSSEPPAALLVTVLAGEVSLRG